MKKIIASCCLLLNFSAMAEWVLVTENEFGTSLFVDPNIKKNWQHAHVLAHPKPQTS